MSQEFIEAEWALFKEKAPMTDIIITTALIPGKPAPLLIPKDVVEAMQPGSVIIDMAAEEGGNCEVTQPEKVIDHNGVTVVGYVDIDPAAGTQRTDAHLPAVRVGAGGANARARRLLTGATGQAARAGVQHPSARGADLP